MSKTDTRRIRPMPIVEPRPAICDGPASELRGIGPQAPQPRSEKYGGHTVRFGETAENLGVCRNTASQVMVKHYNEWPQSFTLRPNKLLDLSRKDRLILGNLDGIIDPDS